jgi:hypothetical protein
VVASTPGLLLLFLESDYAGLFKKSLLFIIKITIIPRVIYKRQQLERASSFARPG